MLFFVSFIFLLLGHWLQNFTSLRFDFWANDSNIAVVLHLLTKPQLRNRTKEDPN